MAQAAANRRTLLDTVKACITQTNVMTKGVAELHAAHNTLAEQTAVDVRLLTSRCDAQIALIKALEAAADRERPRLTSTRSEIAQVNIERNHFTDGLSFFQRLRWIFTGSWPKPGTYDEVTARAINTSREADAAIAAADKTIVLAHASRVLTDVKAGRRMSAGMAPRPLP